MTEAWTHQFNSEADFLDFLKMRRENEELLAKVKYLEKAVDDYANDMVKKNETIGELRRASSPIIKQDLTKYYQNKPQKLDDIHDVIRDKIRNILKKEIQHPTETELAIYEQVVLPLLRASSPIECKSDVFKNSLDVTDKLLENTSAEEVNKLYAESCQKFSAAAIPLPVESGWIAKEIFATLVRVSDRLRGPLCDLRVVRGVSEELANNKIIVNIKSNGRAFGDTKAEDIVITINNLK